MIDIEKFLISLRSNKDHDGKLKPIYLADTVQEEIKIIHAAVDNSRLEWVRLTADEIWKCNKAETGGAVEFHICVAHQNVLDFAEAIEAKLKEKNT